MKSIKIKERYVAFLRGINVGGHHKLPMADLRREMERMHFENVITILNSGNIIFDAVTSDLESLEIMLSSRLEKAFDFRVPTIIRRAKMINELLESAPFKDIEITKDIRLYVSFLRGRTEPDIELPLTSDDNAYTIIKKQNKTIVSVLDLSISNTPKGMGVLEKFYGKDITTRNWNTIVRIGKKL